MTKNAPIPSVSDLFGENVTFMSKVATTPDGLSPSLTKFLNEHVVDPVNKVYKIDNFTITNNGVLLDGRSSAETLIGGRLNDLIWGNGGHDTLSGREGTDLLTGGAGNDLMYGGSGNDRLEGWDGADRVYGDVGNDALFGNTGNDSLYGGTGNDYLCAGSGTDILFGGAGADVFVFRPEVSAPRSTSTYHDFQLGIDELRIESDLMPNGFTKSMIRVEADGDLFIQAAGGHRMVFETLDRTDINALYDDIVII